MIKQVERGHYNFKNYMQKPRWFSYWRQLNEVLQLNPHSVLIVGTGDNIIRKILDDYIPVVRSLDIDSELKPDYLGSVSECSGIVDQTFDCVVCCQVLEHLPFADFEICIKELSKITAKNCVISLPQKRFAWGVRLILFNLVLQFGWVWTRFGVKHCFDGEHYWEIGTEGTSKTEIKRILLKYFRVKRCYSNLMNSYHRFYILEKNETVDSIEKQ